MRPKKYPYSGTTKTKKSTREEKLEMVVFPNIAIRKDLLKHIYTVIENHDNTTNIYFRIPKNLGYEEQRARVRLSYQETLKKLNFEVTE